MNWHEKLNLKDKIEKPVQKNLERVHSTKETNDIIRNSKHQQLTQEKFLNKLNQVETNINLINLSLFTEEKSQVVKTKKVENHEESEFVNIIKKMNDSDKELYYTLSSF